MNDNELKAFIGLHRVVDYLDKEVAAVHKEYGLTFSQFAVLEVLYHKEDMCVGDVQEKILSSTGTIPVIVKNLEKQDLIKTKVDENDKRKKILSLTDSGREIIEKAYPPNEEKIKNFMNVLSKEELETLVSITKKLDPGYGGKNGKTN